MTPITPEQRDFLKQSGDLALRVFDLESNAAYVLVPADEYERLRPRTGPMTLPPTRPRIRDDEAHRP